MHIHWLGFATLLSSGCYSSWETKDADGDGVSGLTDCWESAEDPVPPVGAMEYDSPIRAADIYVGAEDRPYDGIDQNCDGLDDFDQDGDGFVPNAYVGVATLGLLETGELPGGDCDDEDALRHPDTEEVCDGVINGCDATLPENEIDNDGDGFVDCTVVDSGWQGDESVQGGDDCDDDDPILFPTQEWYGDSDSDGFGEDGDVQISCTEPDGHVLNRDDCNDDDATIYPEATEICDGLVNACGGVLPEDEIDNDGDGYVECSIDSDGWDGAVEVVGGDDCSDTDGTVFVSQTYYIDTDQDGYGTPNVPMTACEQPNGYVLNAEDCNDDDATVYLNAPELCDGQSNACAATIPADETDYDIDGYVECSIDGGGWDGDTSVIGGNDCDDFSATEFPGQVWYADLDNDTFGNPSADQVSCQQPSNTSLDNTDCDDTDDTVYPGATELCDGQLNACGNSMLSGEVDADGDGYAICSLDSGGWDGLGTVIGGDDCADGDAFTFPGAAFAESILDCMRDEDEDGYGSQIVSGSTISGTDCDDEDATIHPNAAEICDGQINTCVGNLPSDEIDGDGDGYVECTWDSTGWDGVGTVVGGDDCNDADPIEFPTQEWYQDSDGDEYGGDVVMNSCLKPSGFEATGGDCDDDDPMTYPSASEICDGVVNDCGGGNLPSNETDDDGDGYVECEVDSSGWNGSSQVVGGDDCLDSDAFTYPGAASAESATDCMRDADLDGYGDDSLGQSFVAGHDCDDNEDTVYEGAPELCDGQLNSCYNQTPVYLEELDTDGDGYVECAIDSGGWDGSSAVVGGDDCNDNVASIHPFAAEDADTVDNNCDNIESSRGIFSCVGDMGSFGGTDKYFLFCDVSRHSVQAHFLCEDSGYDDLASINSVTEMNFAVSLASSNFLIGYSRSSSSAPWEWMDGSTGTYEFDPFTQSGGGTNTVVELNGNGTVARWRAVSSTFSTRFVCSSTF